MPEARPLRCQLCGTRVESLDLPCAGCGQVPDRVRAISILDLKARGKKLTIGAILSVFAGVPILFAPLVAPYLFYKGFSLRSDARRLGVPMGAVLAVIFVFASLNLGLGCAYYGRYLWAQRFSPGTLYVDNGYAEELAVTIDGLNAVRVPPQSCVEIPATVGRHQVEVKSSKGDTVLKAAAPVNSRGKYLLNPGLRRSYRILTIYYNMAGGSSDTIAGESREFWDVSKYDAILKPLPKSIVAEQGTRVTRQAVIRAD